LLDFIITFVQITCSIYAMDSHIAKKARVEANPSDPEENISSVCTCHCVENMMLPSLYDIYDVIVTCCDQWD